MRQEHKVRGSRITIYHSERFFPRVPGKSCLAQDLRIIENTQVESNMNKPQTQPFGLTTIGQIAVPVADLDRAVVFYRDTLGMTFLFQAPPGLAFFDLDGVRLLLDVPAKAQPQNYSSIIYYKVPDIQAAHQTLIARGVTFDQEPELVAKMPDHELWMAFFQDPDDNILALMCEVPL